MSKTEDKAFIGCFSLFVAFLFVVMVVALVVANQR